MKPRRSFRILTIKGLGTLCAVSVLLLLAAGAHAQTSDVQRLLERLDRLERDIATLQRQVYRGAPAAPGGAPVVSEVAPPEAAARMEVRISQMESELRQLTGQVEENGHGIDRLTKRLDTLVSDIEFRLGEIEKRGGTGVSAAAGQQPGQQPAQNLSEDSPGLPSPAGASTQQSTNQQGPGAPPGVLTLPRRQDGGGAQPPTPAAARPAQPSGPLPSGSPKEKYDFAFGLLKQGNYDQAAKALEAFVEAHPKDALAGNAQYWLGETHYVRGEFQQAAIAFLKGYQQYPKNPKASDNLLKLGMSLANLGQNKEACATFGRLTREYPQASDSIKQRVQAEKSRLGGCN